MPQTSNYNLTKPENGSSNWGDAVNTNFDVIDSTLKANADAVLNHINTSDIKHKASQISTTDGNDVETKLTNIEINKANANHSHTNVYSPVNHSHANLANKNHNHNDCDVLSNAIPNETTVEKALFYLHEKIKQVEDFLDYINPNISNASLNISHTCLPNAIIFQANLTPDILIRRFNVHLYDSSNNIISMQGSNTGTIVIEKDFLQGQELHLEGNVIVGKDKIISYSKQSIYYNSLVNNKVVGIDITPTENDPIISEYAIRKHLGWSDDDSIGINPNIFVQVILDGQSISYSRQIKLDETNNIKHLSSIQLLGLKEGQKYKVVLQVNKSKIK